MEAAAATIGVDQKLNYNINEDAYALLPVILNILKEKKSSMISGSEDERSPEIVAEEITWLNKEIQGLENDADQTEIAEYAQD